MGCQVSEETERPPSHCHTRCRSNVEQLIAELAFESNLRGGRRTTTAGFDAPGASQTIAVLRAENQLLRELLDKQNATMHSPATRSGLQRSLDRLCANYSQRLAAAFTVWKSETSEGCSTTGCSEIFLPSSNTSTLDVGVSARSMSRGSVIALFESVLEEKALQDARDWRARREWKSIAEFLGEFVGRQVGLPSLAKQKISQLVQGAISLHSAGDLYGSLICSLLHLGTAEPMPRTLAICIPHLRAAFRSVSERRKKEPERPRSRSVAGKKTLKGDRESEVELRASLLGVCDLVSSLFSEFPLSGALLLQSLRPESLSTSDFLLFKICHRLSREALSPESLFQRLDADHGGTVDRREFFQGLKNLLGGWVSAGELEAAMSALAQGGGEITLPQFLRFVSFETYREQGLSHTLKLSAFLHHLSALYNSLVSECSAVFTSVCSSEEMELREFTSGLQALDPSINASRARKLFNQVPAKVDQTGFCELCQRMMVGKFRCFGKHYADARRLIEEKRE